MNMPGSASGIKWMQISRTFPMVSLTRQHISPSLMQDISPWYTHATKELVSPILGLDAEGLKDGSGSKGRETGTRKLVSEGRNELGGEAWPKHREKQQKKEREQERYEGASHAMVNRNWARTNRAG